MAWDDQARTKYAADQSATTARVTFLVTRDELLMEIPFEVRFAEQSTSSATYTPLYTFNIYVPEWAVRSSQIALKAIPEVKVDAGSGAWRLYDVSSATDGDEVTGITGTIYDDSSEGSLTIDTAWADSKREFGIKGKNDGVNLFYIKNEVSSPAYGRMTFWFEAL